MIKPINILNAATIFLLCMISTIAYSADSDSDGIDDAVDNCTLVANKDQRDTNGNGYGNACDGDLNIDGIVNTLDASLFKNAFNKALPDTDFNGDGQVNNDDQALLTSWFGKRPGPGAPLTANTIMSTGHGIIFDTKKRNLNLDPVMLRNIQTRLTNLLVKIIPNIDDNTSSFLKAVDTAILGANNNHAIITFLQAAKIKRLLDIAPTNYKAAYNWRNTALLRQAQQRFNIDILKINPSVLELLRNGGLIFTPPDPDTTYIQACRDQNVPIPPDFSPSSVDWHYQGDLTYNILGRDDFNKTASVYTYSDPLLRGACIALPRGRINPMTDEFTPSVAGIICQSASTGRACIWDNLRRAGGALGSMIPWDRETMVIRQLQDGDMLSQNCTGCHSGNNVFIMTPDDSAWRKVMRGPLNGSIGTFTTRIESAPGVPAGIAARYTPVSAMTPPRWTNPVSPPSCSGGCHASPSPGLLGEWNAFTAMHDPTGRLMPPRCASGGGIAGCYNNGL